MLNIDIYKNSSIIFERKNNLSINLYILFIIFILIISSILITTYKYQDIKTFHGTINDDSISLLMTKNDLNILDSYDLYIDNKKVNYSFEVNDYITDLNAIYYNVIIKGNIKNSKCVFKSKKTTILKEIRRSFK